MQHLPTRKPFMTDSDSTFKHAVPPTRKLFMTDSDSTFKHAAPAYQKALHDSGYQHQRTRNIKRQQYSVDNHSFSKNVKTNIGWTFLSLISSTSQKATSCTKCSHTTSRLAILSPETWPALSQPHHQGQLLLLQKHDQHCHCHNIKVSYSCSRNMTSIVTAKTSRSATLAPETWPALSLPQHQGQLLLLQKHDQHCHSHNIKVSYYFSRNMTSIVTATTSRLAIISPETWPALSQPQHQGQLLLLQKYDQHCHSTTSRSATLDPETWPALSQPQHQGQLLLLQKYDQHCHSHNIKVSYSCSRNMTSIVTATTSRSATLAPEIWPALSQPQHQGQLLLLQKHDQHCHSHNIKVSYSCSRNMTSIVIATTSRSATLAPETWPALSQPQHQGQLLLLQKHDQHCHSYNIKVS